MNTNYFRLPYDVLINIIPTYLERFVIDESTKNSSRLENKFLFELSLFDFITYALAKIGASGKTEHFLIQVYYPVCSCFGKP